MDEHTIIIPQAAAGTAAPHPHQAHQHHSAHPDLTPVMAAIAGLAGKVDATNGKVDTLAGAVTELREDVNKMDRNLNGDGSRKDRGWVGLIEELQARFDALKTTVDAHGGKWQTALNLANSAGLLLLGWWINNGSHHKGP